MAHAPEIVFGTAGAAAWSTEQTDGFLQILKNHNVKELDTAFVYVSRRICVIWDVFWWDPVG